MKNIILIITIFIVFSCSKTLNINDFSNDFFGYEPEIKIEAVILPTENTAIVRIDRSFTLNDTSLYDCIDNDGDWISSSFYCSLDTLESIIIFDDLPNCTDECTGLCIVHTLNDDLGTDGIDSNESSWVEPDDDGSEGNGLPDCGEPHVDEYDEVLPKVHITDCEVYIYHNDDVCSMVYDSTGGSFYYNEYNGFHAIKGTDVVSYGAYIPNVNNCNNFNWQNNDGEYSFSASCPGFEENGEITSNIPITLPQPVVFFNNLDFINMTACQNQNCLESTTTIEDTVYYAKFSENQTLNYASLLEFPYYQLMQFHKEKDSDDYYLTHEHPFQATDVENIFGNICLVPEAIVTKFVDADEDGIGELDISKYVVYTFSESFTNYYFFDLLDIHDPTRTNLRDAHGNTIMGTFGAMASNSINIRIVDCEVEPQHPICQITSP